MAIRVVVCFWQGKASKVNTCPWVVSVNTCYCTCLISELFLLCSLSTKPVVWLNKDTINTKLSELLPGFLQVLLRDLLSMDTQSLFELTGVKMRTHWLNTSTKFQDCYWFSDFPYFISRYGENCSWLCDDNSCHSTN